MDQVVLIKVENKVATIVISNPPVNSLSLKVRKALFAAVELADSDSEVSAIVIKGDGKVFSAGADIKEFVFPLKAPNLPIICNRIENCSKPVVAAIQGVALGGGLEIALASHYRVATSKTRLGLPEVHLGLLPGAGGTQRLPRLVGIEMSIDIISSGRSLNAAQSLKLGIIDALVEDLDQNLLKFVSNIIDTGGKVRPTRENVEKIKSSNENKLLISESRKTFLKKSKFSLAHHKILDCIESTMNLSFCDALKFENDAFVQLRNMDESKGMIHAFFAERASSKIPEMVHAKPRKLKKIGVIGGGTLGSGITIAAMQAGLDVLMIERDEASLGKVRVFVKKVFDQDVENGRITNDKKKTVVTLYNGSTDYNALSDVDLVIESVFEDMEIKKSIFKILDEVVPQGTILASTTSNFSIEEIAKVTERAPDVIGLHFLSSASLTKLIEIVISKATSESAISTCFDFAKKLRKIPVRAVNCNGFIGNRIFSAYADAAGFMMEDGASPYEIDRAVKSFGCSIGPFQMFDLAGLDICWATRKLQSVTRASNVRYVEIVERLCERGWFGQKTGRGFYKYTSIIRCGAEDTEVLQIIQRERDKKNIKPRKFTDGEIIRRYMAAMVNEGANVLFDGVALRPSDIDVVKLHGYGFPRFRGGPMKYADTYGLKRIIDDLDEFAKEDSIFWTPSPLILDLVNSGKNFEDLNN